MRKLLIALIVLLPAIAHAQPRPGAFTVLTTTDTTEDSLHVGCTVGSPTCTGGIKAGPIQGTSIRVTSSDAIEITSGVPGTTTNKLYNNSGNLYFNGNPLATGASLSGTTNTVAKFTGSSTVGNSNITDNGTAIGITGNTSITGTLAASGTVDFASSIQAGSGNVTIIGTDGRIPAISSTYFANLSGANITGIAATTLAAGTHSNVYNFSSVSNTYSGIGTSITGLNATELTTGTMPAGRYLPGMVMQFHPSYYSGCPTGWADVAASWGGRYIVINPVSGTPTVVGIALSQSEDRAVGAHSHTASSSVSDPGHVHGVSDPGHSHSVPIANSANLAVGADWNAPGTGGSTTGSASTGISINAAATGIGVSTTVNSAGSVAGTNAPYVALLTCYKI